jgi:hypothetical protein
MNQNIYTGIITVVSNTITLKICIEHCNNLHLLTKTVW